MSPRGGLTRRTFGLAVSASDESRYVHGHTLNGTTASGPRPWMFRQKMVVPL